MKKIKNLTIEELKQVFNNNQKLQDDVLQVAQEDSCFWIQEYMNCFDGCAVDYNIGYPGNYITIKNQYEFIQGIKELQRFYCYLSEEDEKNALYAEELIKRYNKLPYYDEKNADRLNLKIEELTEKVKNNLLKQLVNEYNYYYDTKKLCNYFIEMYADNMTEKYYVDNNYTLYQHIEYVKCYK